VINLKGSYFLLISNKKDQKIKIGKILKIDFPTGNYIYIGSAMGDGSTSLEKRLKRHVTSASTKNRTHPHWHIDYLLVNPQIEIIAIYILPNSVQKEECTISHLIRQYSDDNVPNFGSSDCACRSHLYYFIPKSRFIHQLLEHDDLDL